LFSIFYTHYLWVLAIFFIHIVFRYPDTNSITMIIEKVWTLNVYLSCLCAMTIHKSDQTTCTIIYYNFVGSFHWFSLVVQICTVKCLPCPSKVNKFLRFTYMLNFNVFWTCFGNINLNFQLIILGTKLVSVATQGGNIFLYNLFFMITAEILARSLANFHCQ